jgi:ABC-2 type transport system permease protein
MTAVYRRELNSYFKGLTGYVFAAFMLLFIGIYCAVINLRAGYAAFEYVLDNASFIYIIIIPILPCVRWRRKGGRRPTSFYYACRST